MMAGYTHHWNCRICDQSQETIDNPRVPVCDTCERPLAIYLCREALGVKLDAEGVDTQHWMSKAHDIVGMVMHRWKPLLQRDMPMGRPEILQTEGTECFT